MSAPVFELEGAGFTYPGASQPALDRLDIEVPDGDFLGVIGPNGSGKTTLLRLLSRVVRPRSGRIRFQGRELGGFPARELARLLAVVPQFSEIVFPFTAREIVLMGRHPYIDRFRNESRRDLEIIDAAMAETDTLHLGDRLLRELSGGERQRIIIARALAQEPRVMLLDEPGAHLDIKHQVRIHELLRHLNAERGLTVIMISHDLNFASEYCRNLLILDRGRAAAMGPPDRVLDRDLVRRVYQVEIEMLANPRSGRPYFLTPAAGESPWPPPAAGQRPAPDL